jgi:branched-chain amino acid transport system permease protein
MWFNVTFNLCFFESVVLAAFASGVLSVGTYLVVFGPAKRRGVGATEMIIISFGLSVFLRNMLQFPFGYEIVYFDVQPPTYMKFLGVGVTSFDILAVATVITLSLLFTLFIQKSRYGKQIRALANDEGLAQVSGINPLAVTLMVWFFAGVVGGLAGGFFGVKSAVMPGLGWEKFLLLILVVGGSRNIWGVVIAAFLAGLVLSGLTLATNPAYALLILIVVFMVVLKRRTNPALEAAKV